MKKFLWLALIGLSLSAGGKLTAVAQETNGRGDFMQAMFQWGGGLEPHINHLNRMVGHVRWQLGRYHGDPSVRREFAGIRRDVDQVNATFKGGKYDRRQLRREIDGLHARLHDLEVRMHVRTNDYYSWR